MRISFKDSIDLAKLFMKYDNIDKINTKIRLESLFLDKYGYNSGPEDQISLKIPEKPRKFRKNLL